MSENNNDMPAFPSCQFGVYGDGQLGVQANHSGLTLRDYFAAKAMGAIIGAEGVNQHESSDLVDAKIAYRYADAMLKAREKQS